MFIAKKRGTLLLKNVIFIILNLIFLSVIILFLFKQGGGAITLEQSYAKNIALLIDSAKPVMELRLNMKQGMELAEKNNVPLDEIVQINDNIVRVKLSERSGYEYSFFNNIDVTVYPDVAPSPHYIIKINGYKNE